MRGITCSLNKLFIWLPERKFMALIQTLLSHNPRFTRSIKLIAWSENKTLSLKREKTLTAKIFFTGVKIAESYMHVIGISGAGKLSLENKTIFLVSEAQYHEKKWPEGT